MRVRYDSCRLDRVGALFWRAEIVGLLIVEETGAVGGSASLTQRLHVLLAGRAHGLHGISVGSSSIIDLVGVHDCSVSALPKSLLKANAASTSTLASAALRDGHSL